MFELSEVEALGIMTAIIVATRWKVHERDDYQDTIAACVIEASFILDESHRCLDYPNSYEEDHHDDERARPDRFPIRSSCPAAAIVWIGDMGCY